MSDGPDVAAAKRLLDRAKEGGFTFQRVAPGEDGPVLGVRETVGWRDEILLGGVLASRLLSGHPTPPLVADRAGRDAGDASDYR